MFKSARLKLTLWYFLTISFVLLLFSALIYRAGSILLTENLSRLYLRLNAQELNIPLPPHLPRNLKNLETKSINFESDEFIEDLSFAKQRLLFNLILIDLGILAVSTFLAYLLAGKTLAPIEKALLAQKRFTADAAHELRTPLTAIKTALEVNLKDKKINKDQAMSVLRENLKDIASLEKLSNDLLLLSRVEHNHQEIKQRTIALDELLDELTNKFQMVAKTKSVKISVKAGHDLIKTDADKLIQVLSILLDNAIKYTPKAGRVQLSFFIEKNKAVFQVKDSGIGISKEDLPFIFDRFYKVEVSRSKNKSAGFGLGLSIASEIAKSLNARLSVESEATKGSTFTLRLC
ncbi:HAMP domain-containing histidine kinase [Patescibacteria group bacterium]|nr:HAMP domain-containing histidine kinase [Patescibacteria group bacterium]